MSQRNPPDEIASLITIVGAADSWAGYSRLRIVWAEATIDELPDTGPMAILSLKGSRQFRIVVVGAEDMTEADVHALAQDLAFQIQTRYRLDMTGLHIPKEPSVGEVGEPSEWMKAAGENTHAVQIDGSYGISID